MQVARCIPWHRGSSRFEEDPHSFARAACERKTSTGKQERLMIDAGKPTAGKISTK
jgi:hypothetical protein